MYQQNGIKSLIARIFSNQFNLVEKFESILIYLFLTGEEIRELQENNRYKPDFLFVGESIIWEYGSKYDHILEEFESANHYKQRKLNIFDIPYKIITSLIKSIYMYFYIDELFMDGYLQTESIVCNNDQFHSSRRILCAPNSRICSICNWYHILPLIHNKIASYSVKYKLIKEHKSNYWFNLFSAPYTYRLQL